MANDWLGAWFGPWMDNGGLLLLAAGLVVAGSIVRGGQWLRIALFLAGLTATADALVQHRPISALLLAVLLTLFNALALLRLRGGRGPSGTEAENFASTHLSQLKPGEARMLIAQGSFISARAGEVLTDEGQPVDNLYFLVSGAAAVLVDNVVVGRLKAGDLIGEACLLDDPRASATVRLADNCRLWFAEKTRLKAMLALHPAIAAGLNAATMAALRNKLERSNRDAATG